MRYFMANLRFGDEKAAKERGFASTRDMDLLIINMWRSRIQYDDDVYILGGFISANADCKEYRMLLPGHLHLVTSEYDYHLYRSSRLDFSSISTENFITKNGWNYHLYPGSIVIDKAEQRVNDIIFEREKPLEAYRESVAIDSAKLDFFPVSRSEISCLSNRKRKEEASSEPFLLETVLPEGDASYETKSALLQDFFRKLDGLDGGMKIFYYEEIKDKTVRFRDRQTREGIFVLNRPDAERINGFKEFVYLCRVGDLLSLWAAEDQERLSKYYGQFRTWTGSYPENKKADEVLDDLRDAGVDVVGETLDF